MSSRVNEFANIEFMSTQEHCNANYIDALSCESRSTSFRLANTSENVNVSCNSLKSKSRVNRNYYQKKVSRIREVRHERNE